MAALRPLTSNNKPSTLKINKTDASWTFALSRWRRGQCVLRYVDWGWQGLLGS
jgi:hypothetical protein